ncbi:hypothetical protein PRZ48_002331 [Zasmidium cellare]|uniref:Uncharacterized protein n=1 Tax=Zasmidium cellare TaxID=395010 RepID=A0ABR0F3X7_ZASCE|nr:hypothetical protein PRZ48_002331 [Zasmidium cellare]
MVTGTRKTVLITGCSPGRIGAALCEEFRRRSFHVFATLRDPKKAESLSTEGGPSEGIIEVLPLDVMSKESIQQCAAQLRAKGIDKLDVLVNNAGSMLISPILDVDLDDCRKLFETNVFGSLAVTQAFAPAVIAAKGTILNICSIAGALHLAWQGPYCASKAAQTFLSENLRIELEPLGAKVVTAMVGEVETQLWRDGASYQLPKESYYKSVEKYTSDLASGKLAETNEPAAVVARNLVNDVLGDLERWFGRESEGSPFIIAESSFGTFTS